MSTVVAPPHPRIENLDITVYRLPAETRPESEGAPKWEATTVVVVEARNNGLSGIGYSYTAEGAATVIANKLRQVVIEENPLSPQRIHKKMVHAVRNLGRPGIAAAAISAVDASIWDLKARILGLPLVDLLGGRVEALPVYGSGGCTWYGLDRLSDELAGWVERGIRRVKMKVGRGPEEDARRVAAARRAIGPDTELMVDADGAFHPKQAIGMAQALADQGVRWFEEPVSFDDLDGLRFVRERVPMSVAAGEHAYEPYAFRRLLAAGSVDVVQADATRCLGITGLLQVAALCEASRVPLSLHAAPALHVHPGLAVGALHVEYFRDHVRLEEHFFEGAPQLRQGKLWPDRSRAGNGLELDREKVERYRVSSC